MSYEIQRPGAGKTRMTDAMFAKAGLIPFEITAEFDASADANLTAEEIVPVDGHVVAYRVTCLEAATFATATHLSFGTSDDIDELFENAIADLNAAGESLFDYLDTPNSAMAGFAPALTASNGSGAAAGSITTGKFIFTVWGYTVAKHESL